MAHAISNPADDEFTWRQLITSLALADRFEFDLMLCGSPRVAEEILSPLRVYVSAERERPVDLVRIDPYHGWDGRPPPLTSVDLIEQVLVFLLDTRPDESPVDMIYAVDGSRAPTEHDEAWCILFQRMNERRNDLTRHLNGPLLLCLPSRLETEFAHAAPDFWSVRSLVVRFAPALAERVENRTPKVSFPPLKDEGRVLHAAVANARVRLEEISADPQVDSHTVLAAWEALSIWLSRLSKHELERQRLEPAEEAAEETLTIHRNLLEREPACPRRLRNIAASLDLLSDVSWSNNQARAAVQIFRESLEKWKQAVSDQPDRLDWERMFNDSQKRLGTWLAHRLDRTLQNPFDSEERLWELPLGETFPLNLDRCLVFLPDAKSSDTPTQFGTGYEYEVILTLNTDPEGNEHPHNPFEDSRSYPVEASFDQLIDVFGSNKPRTALARLISTQVPRQHISPYQLGGRVKKPSMFFGRQQLLDRILAGDPANYLLVGGRQIGKSTLLEAIYRSYKANPDVHCYNLALASEDLLGYLAPALGLPRNTCIDKIVDHITSQESRQLFLVDEAEDLVRAERQEGYPILGRLLDATTSGRAHFILAGFWNTYEAATFDEGSPLKKHGKVLRIAALEKEACKELATIPMETMGLRYESSQLVDRVVEDSGQRPNLISLLCSEALKSMDPAQRIISSADFTHMLESSRIKGDLDIWAWSTPYSDGGQIDRSIAHSNLGRGPFTLEDALRDFSNSGKSYSSEQVKRSLDRLELAYILKSDGPIYSLAAPIFQPLIRDQQDSTVEE